MEPNVQFVNLGGGSARNLRQDEPGDGDGNRTGTSKAIQYSSAGLQYNIKLCRQYLQKARFDAPFDRPVDH